MDNNRGELSLRGAVIGRRLSFGSDSEKGAGFTATMYSVAGTLAINGIDVRRWLREWLTACAENTGAVYRASGWTRVGTTQGRGRYDRHTKRAHPKKHIWLRPLRKDWRRTLNR